MRKTFMRLWMLAAVMLPGLASCTSNDDNAVDNNETIIDPGNAEWNPQKLTIADVWVADGVDADLKQAFAWASVTVAENPADAAILVVNKLTDVSEDILKLHMGGENTLVCVVNPVKAELDAYAEGHAWAVINTALLTDETMILGFNGAGQVYNIQKPDASENADPILTNINRAQDYYVFISSMLKDFGSSMQNGSNDVDEKSIEAFGSQYHYSVTYSFTCKEEFKHVLWSDADYHNGSGAMTASFDIYTAHVYEGEPGAGDYYAVRMTASLASAGMWKGKGDNTHGGVHVRWCGAYATDFIAEAHLREHNADWNQDLSDRIMFPSGGFPSPSTTVGKTTYTDTNSFSLNMSQTVGASKKSGTDGHGAKTEAGIEGSVSFSEGWTWQHSESRSISDVDVANETKNGYWARWHLTFNNLPEFKFSEDYGFDIKNNIASRSTMDLHASWLWYDKSGKDNQDRTPYDLCVYMKATYGHQNWTSTEADLYKKSWQWNSHEELIIPLEKVVNVTAGHLVLKNDLPEGMNISNVKVLNADDNTEVSEFENTIPNGGELLLGTYNSNLRYLVTFKARKSGADTPRTYKYTTNPSIKLNHKAKTTLYANGDFTEQ
ncbi:MAG: hypothetical protein J6O54_02690 [Prevotella sp.]|nr:hypothetical protein [Prevotella sp.]